eukprot:1755811-Pyramimonas_sp.AAC.1
MREDSVICLQECRVLKDSISQKEQSMPGEGWKLRLSPAVQTEHGGVSSGVGIGVRSCVGVGEAQGHHSHLLHSRCSIVWVNGCVKGGYYLATVYLPDGEGILGARGQQILHASRRPFIVSGDFNSLPSEVQQSNSASRMRGAVAGCNKPACR